MSLSLLNAQKQFERCHSRYVSGLCQKQSEEVALKGDLRPAPHASTRPSAPGAAVPKLLVCPDVPVVDLRTGWDVGALLLTPLRREELLVLVRRVALAVHQLADPCDLQIPLCVEVGAGVTVWVTRGSSRWRTRV